MRSLLLVLLLSSTCHADWCWHPCSPPWRQFSPDCQPIYEEPQCVTTAMLAECLEAESRGVGNMAHLSQTGSDGGSMSGLWTGGTSSSIGGTFDFGGGGFGGIGGGWNGPGTKPGGPTGGLPNGDGSGGSEIPSKPIPEPSSLLTWILIGGVLWLTWRKYNYLK
jgi:hypothetical protein